jgi:hypothetical protein
MAWHLKKLHGCTRSINERSATVSAATQYLTPHREKPRSIIPYPEGSFNPVIVLSRPIGIAADTALTSRKGVRGLDRAILSSALEIGIVSFDVRNMNPRGKLVVVELHLDGISAFHDNNLADLPPYSGGS